MAIYFNSSVIHIVMFLNCDMICYRHNIHIEENILGSTKVL